MVTIKSVAEEAKVSVMTVSRVINHPGSVSDRTKQRVLKAIDELQYQPNQTARILKGKRANILGVLIPDFANPFYTDFIKQIEEVATPLGYRLLIASNTAGTGQVENVKYLISRNVDAIIICSYSEIKDASKYILQNHFDVPAVILDRIKEGTSISSVYADGFSGIKNMVEYLIGLGHRRIAMIKGASSYRIANDRFLGYQEALREHGIFCNEQYVWEGDYTMKSGAMAAEYFSSIEKRPTAIVSSSDYMAVGVINYLLQHGYRVPEDFSVTGYDGIHMGELLKPQLTTVALPIRTMARKAVELLIDELENGKKNNTVEVYVGDLLIRGSTGRCVDV